MKLAFASFLLAISSSSTAAFTSVQTCQGSTYTQLWATTENNNNNARRQLLSTAAAAATGSLLLTPSMAFAEAAAVQDSLDVQNFLRTGVDAGGPMGVSSQAGKSRPQTGVVLRDGSDVSQDTRTGDVLAEILTGTKAKPVAVLASFQSPWPLQKGAVFDVECRDGKTGDGAFLAVTKSVEGKSLADLPSSFFLERLFDPTGRFSFYGPPTDVKVKSSKMVDGGNRRVLDITFSILSQSTNAEIVRRALLIATIPEGTDNAVMLTASGLERRWKKETFASAEKTIGSFRAIPAPKSNLKLRAKDRTNGQFDF
mmetsp:Transcript_2404/g.3516  ORF Transcript_2404/g.3516 Transcript_2404/m.3516 type:complete len:312 (-) Transcript_2404:328-1263(-)